MFKLVFFFCVVQPLYTLHTELRFKPSEIDKKSILVNHNRLEAYTTNEEPNFPNLAYITPWNKRGYELAELTARRLSHISPVWFQARPRIKNEKIHNCEIEGSHDINRDWITVLRKENPNLKIVPRIIFDGWNSDDMEHFLIDSQAAIRCAKRISKFYERNEFDGAVIELWTQSLMAVQNFKYKQYTVEVMEILSNVLKEKGLIVIFTVPVPLDDKYSPNNLINPTEYEKLLEMSDYVQIMTYDYIGNRPTGVAPYNWVEKCIDYLLNGQNSSSKTLVGINWYGYEFKNGKIEPILGPRYLEKLKEESSVLEFDDDCLEHLLTTGSSKIYYPSLTSLEMRIMLSRRYSSGIAIWDYGQGLDYFTTLLN